MNMETASEELVQTAKKVGKGSKAKKAAPDRSWIEKGHAEAAAHNAKGLPIFGGRPFLHGDARTIGESSAEIAKEVRTKPARIVIGANIVLLWGTLAAMIFGLMLR